MNKTTFIYISLFLLTSFTLFLGTKNSYTLLFTVIILITTFVKGQLVIDYFMGLKDVKLKYRLFVSIWLALIVVLIGVSYFLPV